MRVIVTPSLGLMDQMAKALGNTPAVRARMVTALNAVGAHARTAIIPALEHQTGLHRGTIPRALHVTMGGEGLSYTIKASGGDVGLKYFGAHETAAGVEAAPRDAPEMFAGAFLKGGRFPNRVPLRSLHGNVYKREGAGRLPITKVASGVVIPNEMVKSMSLDAWTKAVGSELPGLIGSILGGLAA